MNESLSTLRHSASHILAQAVLRLYPDAKLAIGPAIDSGFYYDFDLTVSVGEAELEAIAAEMKKIVKERYRIERLELPRGEALEFVKGQTYKTELIEALPEDAVISFYKQGDFTDLCAGPHVDHTGRVKAFKLLSATGAYWRGDSKNKMLTRIYGTAFESKEELEEHLKMLEEAKKRDHNRLGRELQYFTTVDYIGQGLPIIMPKGSKVMQILQRFVEDEEEKRGYMLTKTPFMAKSDLYKISGHWDHYRDGMFVLGDPDSDSAEVFALRPMTCPFQFQVYLAKTRSYRDLPMRFNETSTLFRNENSGEMHGLIRVRQFTISEGHIACTPEQLEDEFIACVDLANFMLKSVGLEDDVSYTFAKCDPNNIEKYIGSPEQWKSVEERLRGMLNKIGIDYVEEEGSAAFYGPKLDIEIKNVFGKKDTLITIQVDFQLAERFGMTYVDADGNKQFPYVLHRTSIGCYERTLALLIEKYAGALPLWLAPTQAIILPLTDRHHDASKKAYEDLRARGFRIELDLRNEKIGYKIREAQNQKIPYMLVIGDKEQESGTVAVRCRREGDIGAMGVDEFAKLMSEKVASKV